MAVIDRLLEKSCDDRYQNGSDVAVALRQQGFPQSDTCAKEGLATPTSEHRLGNSTADSISSFVDNAGNTADYSPTQLYLDQSSRELGTLADGELGILRRRVKKFWIDGVLSRIEEGEKLLPLHRVMRPDAVVNIWEGVTEAPLSALDAQRPIEEIFVEADRSLLILGQPGAGKSTTLLQLTRQLLPMRNSDPEVTVPVVLHLSTWTNESQSIAAWIEQEVSEKYQIPKNIGRELVSNQRLILLLDGLDEVRVKSQSVCVQKINQFLDDYAPPGIVVSSRVEEYSQIGLRLKLQGAVQLNPLSDHQVLASAAEGRSDSHPLLVSLKKHDAMMDLARSPLMLSVMKLSCDDWSEKSLEKLETSEGAQEQIFEAYVDRMFRNKGKTDQGFSRHNTISWLGWLAEKMDERNQSMLLIEDVQPDWFECWRQRVKYALLLSLSLGLACAMATIFFWVNALRMLDIAEATEVQSMFWMLLQFPVWFLVIAVIDFMFCSSPSTTQEGLIRSVLRGSSKTVVYLVLWMIWPLIGWLTGGWSTGWIISDVLLGILICPMFGMQGRDRRVMADIGTVESLGVSPMRSFVGWLWGLLVGYGLYLAYLWLWAFYLLDTPPEWFPYYWHSNEEIFVSISWPLMAGSVGMVVGGLTPKVRQGITVPNQGMRMSLFNALFAGAFAGVVVAVTAFFGLYYWHQVPENTTVLSGYEELMIVIAAIVWIGFLTALAFGGLDLVKHALTRYILTTAGLIPRNLADFLKHAARLSFLKQAGGAYIFGHQLLLKYFAEKSNSHSQQTDH